MVFNIKKINFKEKIKMIENGVSMSLQVLTENKHRVFGDVVAVLHNIQSTSENIDRLVQFRLCIPCGTL